MVCVPVAAQHGIVHRDECSTWDAHHYRRIRTWKKDVPPIIPCTAMSKAVLFCGRAYHMNELLPYDRVSAHTLLDEHAHAPDIHDG
jgi:hypothetical protein